MSLPLIAWWDKFCDLFLASNGIPMPQAPEEDSHPRFADRAPFPPDDVVGPAKPIDPQIAAVKRKAADKEFWESV